MPNNRTDIAVILVADLLNRYSHEVVPTKAITTQEANAFGIERLKKILGALPLSQVTPPLVHRYFDQRQHKIAARREIEILSHAFTKAMEWGYCAWHPFKGALKLPAEEPRRRYIANWEVTEMLTLEPRRKAGSVRAVQAYVRLMMVTGLRRVDLLRVQIASLKEEGVEVEARGNRDLVTFFWTADLRTAIGLAVQARPAEASPWIFCKRDGTGYFNEKNGRADGWDSMWGRFVDRVLSETNIVERFTEHDVRAKSAIDMATPRRLHGQGRLLHSRSDSTIATQLHDELLSAQDSMRRRIVVSPFCPTYLAEIPVAEFLPASNKLPVHQKKRKLRIRAATPSWADRRQMKVLYQEAQSLTRKSGSLYVVDHIVPLHHPLVCGLHVPANLRVVPERINAKKHNRFDFAELEGFCSEDLETAEVATACAPESGDKT